MSRTSFPKNKIRVLLLENIHPSAVALFEREGFAVECHKDSPDPETLRKLIATVHLIGIRSKTQLTADILTEGKRLLGVGAFCIGTNQIDLAAAAQMGAPVFNAPFSNTRSVAELIISHTISLFRRIPERNRAAHEGTWLKSAEGSSEARGKTIGIIGYGHIGSQVSVLAESLGMRVIFYDVLDKLALGNAAQIADLDTLLGQSDVVTLHVPATEQTKGMFTREAIAAMKPGASLINYSRGNVVDIDALTDAVKSGHVAGAAIDVFPEEPKGKGERFGSPLQNLPNVILTPHIGGSTLEAQRNIGGEVAAKLIKFVNNGSTTANVNTPEVELPLQENAHRILHFHRNEPGVLQTINTLFGDKGINVIGQHLLTFGDIGYLVMDVSEEVDDSIVTDLRAIPETIKARILY